MAEEARVTKMSRSFDPAEGTGELLFKALGKSISYNLDDFSDEIKLNALGLGLNTTLGNSAAGITSVEDAFEAVSARLEQLKKGIWRATSERGFDFDLAAEAVKFQIGGTATIEELKAKIMALPPEKFDDFKKNPEYLSAVAQVKAKRAAQNAAKGNAIPLTQMLG